MRLFPLPVIKYVHYESQVNSWLLVVFVACERLDLIVWICTRRNIGKNKFKFVSLASHAAARDNSNAERAKLFRRRQQGKPSESTARIAFTIVKVWFGSIIQ